MITLLAALSIVKVLLHRECKSAFPLLCLLFSNAIIESNIPFLFYEIAGEMLCTVLLLFYDIFIYTMYLWLHRTHKPAEYVLG